MFGIGPTELIIVLVLALIIFGPGKLPEVGKAIGRSIREFKAASSAVEDTVKQVTTTPASNPTTAAASQPATSTPAAANTAAASTAASNAPTAAAAQTEAQSQKS